PLGDELHLGGDQADLVRADELPEGVLVAVLRVGTGAELGTQVRHVARRAAKLECQSVVLLIGARQSCQPLLLHLLALERVREGDGWPDGPGPAAHADGLADGVLRDRWVHRAVGDAVLMADISGCAGGRWRRSRGWCWAATGGEQEEEKR